LKDYVACFVAAFLGPILKAIDPKATENLFEAYTNRIHPEDVPLLFQHIEKGVDYQFDHRVVLSDGRVTYLTCVGYYTKNENGEKILLSGTSQDVTDRKIAEQAIKELNNDLEQKVIARTAELELSRTNLIEAQRNVGTSGESDERAAACCTLHAICCILHIVCCICCIARPRSSAYKPSDRAER
jgi:hypothetical protein